MTKSLEARIQTEKATGASPRESERGEAGTSRARGRPATRITLKGIAAAVEEREMAPSRVLGDRGPARLGHQRDPARQRTRPAMSMEPSTETQAGHGCGAQDPAVRRGASAGCSASCVRIGAQLLGLRPKDAVANDEDKRLRLGADIESMAIDLAKLERLALAIHEEELAT